MVVLGWEGGNTVAKAVYKIMSRVFTKEMGSQFSWTGKSKGHGVNKEKFETLANLIEVIKGLLLKYHYRKKLILK